MLHIRLTPWLAALAVLSVACGEDGLAGSDAALDAETDDPAPGDDGAATPGDDGDPTPENDEDPKADDCATFSCGEHGFCMPSEGTVHCACSTGYAGDHCETCAPGFVLGGSPAHCAATLSATRPEPAGEHCAHGGVASDSGADLDGNGALDAAEVSVTEYLCNAAPPDPGACEEDTCGGRGACAETDRGAACLCDSAYDGRACELCADGFVRSHDGATCIRPRALSVEQLEARGPRCAAGGIAISRGLDLDDDGQLSRDEVERTDYVCNTARVRTGDVIITSQAGLDDLTGVTEIIGNLRISAPYVTALEALSSLGRVSGNVIIENNPRLESLAGLDALYEVGGRLEAQHNPQLKTATAFGALDRVYGDFKLDSPSLEHVDLGSLQTVGGSLIVTAPLLTELLGGKLLSVVGSLSVSAGPGLTDISGLGRLDAVGSELSVRGSSLPNLAMLEQLREVGGLVLTNHAAITSVSLQQLRAVRGKLVIAANDELESVGPFPALIHVDSDLLINENPQLTSIEGFPQLERAGSLGIASNPQLATIDAFAALTTLTYSHETSCEWLDCMQWGNAYAALELRALPALSRLEAFGNLTFAEPGVTLSGLPALESMADIPGVTRLYGSLRVADVGLTRLPFVALTELGTLYIGQNPRLETLAILDGVISAAEMYIVDNDQLTHAGTWPLLERAYRLEVAGNAVLPALPTMPLITMLNDGLRVEDNAVLRGTAGLPALTQVGNDWTTSRSRFALPSEADEEPRGATVTVLVRANPALTSLSFLSHLKQTSSLAVVDNDALMATELPALTSLQSLFVVDNEQVSSVSLPAEHVYLLDVEANAALTSLASLEMRADDFVLASTPLQQLSATLAGNFGRVTLRQAVTSANLAAFGSGNISELVIWNTSLTSLAGLQKTGAYALRILDNDMLTSLDGLETLVSLGSLTIDDNDTLRSVAGLGAKASSGLGVHNNPVLPTCAAESLAGPEIWGVDISGNDDAGVCE